MIGRTFLNSRTKTITLGILFLFVCINFYIFGVCLNCRLHGKYWMWYDELISSLTPSFLKYLLKPQVSAGLIILTFILTIFMWILHFLADNTNSRFTAPVLFNVVTLSTYYAWLYVFYVKKHLIWVSIV